MAKTVLKHGKEVFKAICPTCGCEFLYNREDIILEEVGADNIIYTQNFVECPDCKYKVDHAFTPTHKNNMGGGTMLL